MLFPTLSFALFFTLVFPLSWLLRPYAQPWRLFLLSVSYFFYGSWDWRFVGLIVLSTLVNAGLAHLIVGASPLGRQSVVAAAIIFNLGLLGIFKYYGFFIASANLLLRQLGLPARFPFLEVLIPVGISFFTFQSLSYIMDVARGRLKPVPLLDFAVFLAFFPHLVAGPIVRAAEFIPQLGRSHLERRQVTRAALLIGQGLFKKVVIASHLSTLIVDPVFASPVQYSALEILIAIYAYAIQIFADFSGYTDMAIGLALLLGIQFPPNFDRPYSATSLQEFWRRWHITLSRWLRDYLYIPLGGNRQGHWQTYRNLLLTMVLGGLWHGAAVTFMLWGLLHGLGLAGERWLNERRGARPILPRWLGWLFTFHLVCLAWVFFRADSLSSAGELLLRLCTAWGPAPTVSGLVLLLIGGPLLLQFLPTALARRFTHAFGNLPLPVQGVALGAFITLTIALGPRGIAPFIYYQF